MRTAPRPASTDSSRRLRAGMEHWPGYLLRLCSLCLTANPYQGLFFLWGRGRNGKGVLIRTLTAILGDGIMAWPLRPSEVTVSRFGDDVMKRAFSHLKGKRL